MAESALELTRAFRRGLGDQAASASPLPDGEALATIVESARAAWPELPHRDVDFAHFLGTRVAAGLPAPRLAETAGELYLGWACAGGDPAAIAAFERTFMPGVARAVSHMHLPAIAIDEVTQAVRARLLVGDPPRIATATGSGSLRGLIKVMAVRLALNWLRDHDRAADPAAALLADPADDPQLQHIKERHGREVKQAIEEAAGTLSRRDRTLLRLHLVEALTIDQIGAIYGVHRATAARRIARARDRLGAETRRQLARLAGLARTDYDSLLRLIDSQLDLSLSRILDES